MSRDWPSSIVEILHDRADRQGDQRAYTFLVNGETEGDTLTFGELEQQACSIAGALRGTCKEGDRALLMYPPGLDFVTAFFGCLSAGVIAVPAYPPHVSRPARCWPRLRSIAGEAGIRAVLCTSDIAARLSDLISATPEFSRCPVLATDQLVDRPGWRQPHFDPDAIAFLQFTSGSTAAPKGVMVSHRNILHNLAYLAHRTRGDSQTVQISWLPTYHDMGLFAGVLFPLFQGRPSYLMSPVSFLQKPVRWLEAISRYRGTNSGGPNFSYELCATRSTPEQREGLDLSSWRIAFTGAEPIRRASLEQFWRVFSPHGFRWESFNAAYGLAEATVFVSGGPLDGKPGDAAAENTAGDRPAGRVIPGCGIPGSGTEVVIVDPERLIELPPGEVGEIWIKSPSVARGYWNREAETEHTFRAWIYDTGQGPYLRTGDLGFLRQGELVVTGRIKDLIIIRGRKFYPQDIEQTVESSHELVLPNASAAVAVPTDHGERLMIVAEVHQRRRARKVECVNWSAEAADQELGQLIGTIRQAVAEEHELQTFGVSLIPQGGIPKTSSGKIQRLACRNAVLAGTLDTLTEWTMQPLRTQVSLPSSQDFATL